MPQSSAARQTERATSFKRRASLTFGICAILLLVFAILSFTAETGKCATSDEPLHGVSSYVLKSCGDYRFNFEDPALWQRWISLAEPAHALSFDLHDPQIADALSDWTVRWKWFGKVLYMTPGNQPDAFLRRERYMLIPLGVMLGALIAFWSWRLSGASAAIAAAALFAFDPNFLAHSSQIKNDVPIAFVSFLLAFVIWHIGRRISIRSVLALIVVASLPLVTKFSGLLLMLILAVLLVVRVLLPEPWSCFHRQLKGYASKSLAALTLYLLCIAAAWLTIWASYSFRFLPLADDVSQWDFQPTLRHVAHHQIAARHADLHVSPQELKAWQPNLLIRSIEFGNQHRLLPQTWLYGLLYTYDSTISRDNFLCGQLSNNGSWLYFPLAYLFKTPIASQIAVIIGIIAAGAWVARLLRSSSRGQRRASTRLWKAAVLLIPFLVLLIADLHSNFDVGIRHLLPVYPFLYVAAALGITAMHRRLKGAGLAITAVLALALVAETAFAYPNYIAFFNTFCGGARGGLRLLGDSNLDWGQDLPALAAWQRAHPDQPLYLCYFGNADPVYYGIRYQPLPGTSSLRDLGKSITMPRQPGIIAISATHLQGLDLPVGPRFIYSLLRDNQIPIDVLNGTIYLYRYDPNR